MENRPFEDVFPIETGDIPACYVSLPEGSRENANFLNAPWCSEYLPNVFLECGHFSANVGELIHTWSIWEFSQLVQDFYGFLPLTVNSISKMWKLSGSI